MPSLKYPWLTPKKSEVLAVRRALWREGRAVECYLDTSGPTGGQQAWVRQLDELPPNSWAVWEISRQRGKTWAALLWLLQRSGLRRTNGVYLAQTGGNAHAIVSSFWTDIELDLPPEWGAKFDGAGGELTLCDSALAWFGTDNQQFKRRRGRKADVVLLDESAFYADLLDVEQVYVPQLQTTGGIGLYLSSPPVSPGHEFANRVRQARGSGRFVHDTFWSNPRINHEAVIRGEMARLNLTREELFASTAWRREFLAEEVTEESRAALPAWTPEVQRSRVVERERPKFFDGYVSIDWGGYEGDPDFALFSWFDFARQVIYFEREFEGRRNDLEQLANHWRKTEAELWGVDKFDGTLSGATDWEEMPPWLRDKTHAQAPRQPYLRVGDHDDKLMASLASKYGYAVLPTPKHAKHVAMDELNARIRQGHVEIHPRCVRLIEQCSTTVWNERRTEWERTPKDHGDGIDCMLYTVRNVRWHRDCRPAEKNPDVFRPPEPKKAGLDALKGMLR